jgi:hypothetical protein
MLYSDINSLKVNQGPKHVGDLYVIIKEDIDKECCDIVFFNLSRETTAHNVFQK